MPSTDPVYNPDEDIQQYYYNKQVRRFLLQFQRMFSSLQFNAGTEAEPVLKTVPIKYATTSRQAADIIGDGSANTFACAPLFSFYINSFIYRRKDVQEPHFVDRKIVRQRKWDADTQTYTEYEGNLFNVQRHMPAPYELGLTLDLWTTNITMKLQILEQFLWIFNPSLEIQSTDSYLDWTSLSTVEIDPNIQWSSKSVPVGGGSDQDIDVCSVKFTLPIWITPPAKVLSNGIIYKIIANIYDNEGDMISDIQNEDPLLTNTRVKVTPHGFQVLLVDNKLQLLKHSVPAWVQNRDLDKVEAQVSEQLWRPTLEEYGEINEGISRIRLEGSDELGVPGSEIIGTITYDNANGSMLIFDIDESTLPANTLDPIDAVIDPLAGAPGSGLPIAVLGTRYLLTRDIGSADDNGMALSWAPGGIELIAEADDIIEYNGTDWIVAWKAGDEFEFITNITTKIQYKWDLNSWRKAQAGIWDGGQWQLEI